MAKEATRLRLSLPPRGVRLLLAHPLLKDVEAKRQRHHDTYFDTPDLTLRKARIDLHQDHCGKRWRQIITFDGPLARGLARRRRCELSVEHGKIDFCAVDDDRVRKLLRGNQDRLAQTFATLFARARWSVHFQTDVLVELTLDRGSIESRGRRLRFCEVELKLKQGKPSDLYDLALLLQQTVPLHPSVANKVERGYALWLDASPPPVTATVSTLTADLSLRHAFRNLSLACLVHLQGNEDAVSMAVNDIEHIHQMRVAIRRLRSLLKLYSSVLPPDFVERWRGPWRDLGLVLGQARNWDVMATRMLPPLAATFPAHGETKLLEGGSKRNCAATRKAVRDIIASPAYARLLLEFASALFSLPIAVGKKSSHHGHGQTLRHFAAHRLALLTRHATGLARQVEDLDGAGRHRLRIAFKNLRYALEFFTPLLSEKRLAPYSHEIALLQDTLGELNDLAVQRALVSTLPGIKADGLVAGWLAARSDCLLRALPEALDRFLTVRAPRVH